MSQDIVSFVRKWNASQLTERSAYQQHFRDLCEALGVPHPTESDEIGTSYTFEKHIPKTGGGKGFADVWKRGYFAWEYKSKGGDLKAAYKQVNEYHEALENPPLLVVCDFVRFEVHTKFENLPSRVYAFTLDDLLVPRDTPTSALPPLEVLRHVFCDFNQLRPNVTAARVTEAAAADFLRLAKSLELDRAIAPNRLSEEARPSKQEIAHFLMRLVFCLFADSVGLLPNHTFRQLITNDRHSPLSFNRKLPVLFQAMSSQDSFFGADNIAWFNGGLFTDSSTIPLNHADLGILFSASQHDWSHIEPAIFGTLFERSLDSSKRSMIGAHYTSPDDILLLIEPVVIAALRRRWDAVQQTVLAALADEDPTADTPGAPSSPAASSPARVGSQDSGGSRRSPAQPTLNLNRPALLLLQDWAAELTRIRILDPACGSGNFLYVALKRLLDLWHEARIFAIAHGLTLTLDPIPNPGQLFGIEIDFYAHEIASIVVWIGFLQWKHDHGIKDDKQPLLQVLDNIQHADAILRYDADDQPFEPTWPPADFIIGNPPFLGGKLLRRELGDTYIDNLFALYKGRVKAESDLVVYWFEKARAQLEANQVDRAGLLATQAIRGGANRAVLERIQQTGTIFWAWSDRKWMLHGAAVHVSMIAFERTADADAVTPPGTISVPSADTARSAGGAPYTSVGRSPTFTADENPQGPEARPIQFLLDGQPVPFINADLTTGSNSASALRLKENEGLCFMGTSKVGAFDLDRQTADRMLAQPVNVNGRRNSDVIKEWVNGLDITRRPRDMYVIDFGTEMSEEEASEYEAPFQYLKEHVQPIRTLVRRENHAKYWWRHAEARPGLREALKQLQRYIATPRVTKYRLFVYLPTRVIPDNQLFAFARDDDYFFGVLHSSIHELWARAQGTQLREVESGFRYTPNSTFDTFPFPYPPGTEPTEADSPIIRAIADAARNLVRLRDAWLNPPNISADDLKDRTLTKLYNARPEWLANAHRTLDEAVFAAYGWPLELNGQALADQEILARLLALNHQRASSPPLDATPRPLTLPDPQ